MKSFEIPTANDIKKVEKNDGNAGELSEKEERLQKIRKSIDGAGDYLGLEIDKKIKEIVVALNAIGFHTTQSCEGHCNDGEGGLITPWVQITVPNEPGYQFINQQKIFEKVAKKHGISTEELVRGSDRGPYWEAYKEAKLNGETDEYKKWNEQNEESLSKVLELLKEYYKKERSSGNEQIHIQNNIEGSFRIYCSTTEGFDPDKFWDQLSEKEKIAAKDNLPKLQAEMDRFADFLLDKYLEE